jgi:putative transcriptional regulator
MKRELREFNPDRLIAELKDFAHDYKRSDFSKYRVTHIDAPAIQLKSPAEILSLREKKLRMSRGAFAKILNVPLETLRAWEKGRRNPSGAAARLLDMVDQMPSLAEDFVYPLLEILPKPPGRRAMARRAPAKTAKTAAGTYASKKAKKGKSSGPGSKS